jgi:uncharacterized membrane protein
MDISDRIPLSIEANRRLERSESNHKRLATIYASVTALVLALASAVTWWLSSRIGDTGGLQGIGMRSILETAATVLQIGRSIALPFWTMGYVFCMLGIARGNRMESRDLLGGFQRFFPLLRLKLYRVFKYFILAILCAYPSSVMFMMTPLGKPVLEIMEPMMQNATDTAQVMAMMDEATVAAITEAMEPSILVFIPMFLLLAAPLYYRLRMADYILLDNPKMGAMQAVHLSTLLTLRKRMQLFLLDLRFWWFYLGMGLSMALCYAPLVLGWFGTILPLWADYACYGGYLVLQFGLTVLARNKVEVTWAVAYESLTGKLNGETPC